MPLKNTPYQYGWLALTLHWLLFLLIAGLLASGNYSDSLPKEAKDPMLIGTHVQIGIAVFGLMLFRLSWRLINPAVRPVETSGALIRMAGWLNHWLLYATVLAQAAGGILMMQLSGREPHLLGFILPRFTDGATFLGMSAGDLRGYHDLGGKVLIALIVIHIAAALVHHFFWHDLTLRRIWFGYKTGLTKPGPQRRD